jgi:hypothetical protein
MVTGKRRRELMQMRRALLALAAVLTLIPLGAGRAFAGGPPQHFTFHFTNVTQTFDDVDPCTFQAATITLTFSGVSHLTVFADGTGHFTETEHGTFAFDYDPPDGQIDATGTFVNWDGGNGLFDQDGNPIGKGEVGFTLNGQGTYTDSGVGFKFHNNAHSVFDEFGNPKLDFFKAHCY